MLRGSAIAKADEKGRLKLPSVFRGLIEPRYGNQFFVTSLRGDSVRIYPMEVWERIEERMARTSSFNPAVIRLKTAMNYFGQTAAMDAQGRILIHPRLREGASIEGEVAVIGQQDHLEVWNRAAFEERLGNEPVSERDLQVVSELGI